jgi:hypothetical protein
MNNVDGVEILTLWERVSERSNRRYFTGFLGSSRLIVFQDEKAELRDGVVAVWKVFARPKDAHLQERRGTRPERPASTQSPSSGSEAYKFSRDMQRPASRTKPDNATASDPAFDDSMPF